MADVHPHRPASQGGGHTHTHAPPEYYWIKWAKHLDFSAMCDTSNNTTSSTYRWKGGGREGTVIYTGPPKLISIYFKDFWLLNMGLDGTN